VAAVQLLCGPSNDIAKWRQYPSGFYAVHLRQHSAISIPHDELHGGINGEQTIERLARHGPWKHIPAHDDLVDPARANLRQHRLQSWQLAVDVVDRRDCHDCAHD
jgi:hypothetical protein